MRSLKDGRHGFNYVLNVLEATREVVASYVFAVK